MSTSNLHMVKKSYKGYCIGECAEYPSVSVFAKSDEELTKNLEDGVNYYLEYLKKNGLKPEKSKVVSIGRRLD